MREHIFREKKHIENLEKVKVLKDYLQKIHELEDDHIVVASVLSGELIDSCMKESNPVAAFSKNIELMITVFFRNLNSKK